MSPSTMSLLLTALRWSVFSGLERGEVEEDEEEEEEERVSEEEGWGALVGAPSAATDTLKRPSLKAGAGPGAGSPPGTASGLRAPLSWASRLPRGCIGPGNGGKASEGGVMAWSETAGYP